MENKLESEEQVLLTFFTEFNNKQEIDKYPEIDIGYESEQGANEGDTIDLGIEDVATDTTEGNFYLTSCQPDIKTF